MFDKLKFQYEVKRNGMTMNDVAQILNINIVTLYRKINGESDFYRSEISKLCNAINFEDPMSIFFAEKIT